MNFHLYDCQVNNQILQFIMDILTPKKRKKKKWAKKGPTAKKPKKKKNRLAGNGFGTGRY
jgi:hypothetical protein